MNHGEKDTVVYAQEQFPTLQKFFQENLIFLNVILKYGEKSFQESINPYDESGNFSIEFCSLLQNIFSDAD